ncbi:MAG: hypothetical protein FIA82_04475 [Melioribacter sp.]|nr:hypothetical protein [Melioribacter sp.]
MKRFRSLLFITALITLPLIYFTACSNKDQVNEPNQINFDSPQFAVIDYFDAQNAIEDATLDKDMAINSDFAGYKFMNSMSNLTPGNPMLRGNPWLEKFDFGKHLGLFFKRLNLSDDQKIQLRNLMTKFHDDMKPLVQQFRDANADIIKAANEARKLIVEDLKAGTITRQEAAEKLKALNEETRDKIKNNPATQTIKESMCALRTTLFNDIASILTPDQLTKWNDFSSKIPNPC